MTVRSFPFIADIMTVIDTIRKFYLLRYRSPAAKACAKGYLRALFPDLFCKSLMDFQNKSIVILFYKKNFTF